MADFLVRSFRVDQAYLSCLYCSNNIEGKCVVYMFQVDAKDKTENELIAKECTQWLPRGVWPNMFPLGNPHSVRME